MITQARLREILHYNPDTGILTWLVNKEPIKTKGKRAGSVHKMHSGHFRRRISIDDREYQEHRIIWLYVTGEWPSAQIDHIDRDACNNRWSNLRLDPHRRNNRNRRMMGSNTSGFRGVSRHGNGFRAGITLGKFKTAEEAHEAYKKASLLLHGEFSPYYSEQK